MNKLLQQILKFGVVGLLCFLIDFAIYTCIANVLHRSYLLAGFLGFTVSVIVNYILSMRYVFKGRKDRSRTREFLIFVILSVLGLGLNELILYFAIDLAYARWNWFYAHEWLSPNAMNLLAKLAATGIVMVYNFVTRKIFLEQKE